MDGLVLAYNKLYLSSMAGAAPSLGGDEVPSRDDSRVIECPQSVLQAIHATALDRFHSWPDGGDLIGILLGTHSGDEVRIHALRPLAAEIRLQITGLLSVEEQEALANLSATAQREAELAGLEPVGWFRSHPESELGLSERDLEIANTFFPHSWQIAMILRPSDPAATCVRFFFRESDGPLTTGSPYQEFLVHLGPAASPAEIPAADNRAPDAGTPTHQELLDDLRVAIGEREGAPESVPEQEVQLRGLERPAFPQRRSLTIRLPVAFRWPAALIAAAGVVIVLFWLARLPAGLALRLFDNAGQLRISWAPLQTVDRAHLEITDGGGKLWIELDPALLRNGSFTYARRSGNITVRLVVERRGRPPMEEAARFLGREGQAPDVRAASSPLPSGRTSPEERKQPLPPEKPTELVVSVPIRQATPDKVRPKFTPPAVTTSRPAPVNRLSAPELGPTSVAAREAPSSAVLGALHVAPPPEEKAAAGRTPPGTGPLTTTAPQAARLPTPATAPAPAPSGRIIWIGRLQKNEPLTISGKSCSSGTLIGELPSKPVKLSISPGDLSNDGIVLYTSNLQYANSVIEPPGAQNGWNKTVYTWNPKHAGDVTLEEPPAARNQWNRLVLRSKNPKISVIVIDWSPAY